ncbi:HAD family phosphatase [Sporosarcina sp. ANT_H38]|uniref:Cof-type HAD-IIB family hydrolase n=1 Tax=Sporosarcina sp. ANT_H38 TaxID=2597358 RepID=UPI0011F2E2E8|nr:Cof-type HAD-IIB family hydrolase [Sporosarcina sp. ANT_H38]KAA0965578.1 HAD family phosphatase [Sporosarcina sp. ANT_H38]
MIQLIAIDMDGTILSPDHSISAKNKQAILAAQSNGIEVVIATGRSFSEAFGPVRDSGLNLSYICLNGAEVRDDLGELISATHIVEADIKKITSILEAHTIDYQLFIDKLIYTKSIKDQMDTFVQLAKAANQIPPIDKILQEIMERVEQGFIVQLDSFDELINQRGSEIYKVFGTSYNRLQLDNARNALQLLPGLAISSSGAGNLEITDINAQKGIAVEQYAKSKGISMANVMVIGDSYNDLSMMERAGHSVAMGNAPVDIKTACTAITTTNEYDGVGMAIEAILQHQN